MDLIVDGPSLFARNFFAASRMLGTASGPVLITKAVSMATTALVRVMQPEALGGGQADRLLIAWDSKQNPEKERKPKPADYHEARAFFREVITTLFNPAHAEHVDYEADDLVATATNSSTSQVTVASGDKDLMQLCDQNVQYYDLNQKAVLSERFILNKWHVKHPSQIAIALAIIGDPVDNIPGLPRWGAKKTQQLFRSVPENASFQEALECIVAQIPEPLHATFWTCLNRTLLNRRVPGVPQPRPIRTTAWTVLESLGFDGEDELCLRYERLADLYEAYPAVRD